MKASKFTMTKKEDLIHALNLMIDTVNSCDSIRMAEMSMDKEAFQHMCGPWGNIEHFHTGWVELNFNCLIFFNPNKQESPIGCFTMPEYEDGRKKRKENNNE